MMFEGLPLIIVQPGAVYGPGDRSLVAMMLRDHLRGRLPAVPVRTSFSWAHADDVAEGHVRAMHSGRAGESYILSGPTHTLTELMETAAKISRRRPPMLRLGPAVLRGMAAAIAPLEGLVPIPSHYASETLRMVAGRTYASTSAKAVRDLSYQPRALRDGLKGTLTDLASRLTGPHHDTSTK
jgi:nucleoside-diphosphate-sugar epimerase